MRGSFRAEALEMGRTAAFELSVIVLVVVLVLVVGLLALLVKSAFGVTKHGQGNKRAHFARSRRWRERRRDDNDDDKNGGLGGNQAFANEVIVFREAID